MLKNKKNIAFAILFLPIAFFIFYTVKIKTTPFDIKELPIIREELGPIPEFSFITHTGDTITRDDIKGKIVVVDFFFTTCPSICPKLTHNMGRVQEVLLYHDKLKSDYIIISHTVDPEHDSVAVLNAYAEEYEVNSDIWHLVTGTKKDIYTLAIDFFMLATLEPDQAAETTFVHSDKFVLIDKEGFIRGFYSGIEEEGVKQLLSDIVNLDVSYQIANSKE